MTGTPQFSSDGKIVAVGTGHINVSSFSNNPLIAIPSDCYVKLFNVENGKRLAFLSHRTPVRVIALSPDGSVLASYTAKDGIQVWNLCYQQEV